MPSSFSRSLDLYSFRVTTILVTTFLLLATTCRVDAWPQRSCEANKNWWKATEPPSPMTTLSGDAAVHRWAYQYFVYLTRADTNGKAKFENFLDPRKILSEKGVHGKCPHENLTRYSTVFQPRFVKKTPHKKNWFQRLLDKILQADGFILIDQEKLPVYYSFGINQDFCEFIKNNSKDSPDWSKIKDFKPGVAEIKSAWRIAEIKSKATIGPIQFEPKTYIKDTSRFYTTEAYVPLPGGRTVQVKLALVGLHVGVKHYRLPFLLWSTFEHVDNVPNCCETPSSRLGWDNWSFNNGHIDCLNESCNQPKSKWQLIRKWNATELCRMCPGSGARSGNKDCIDKLNETAEEYSPSPWQHYRYIGALWTVQGSTTIRQDNESGSLRLANTSMESFTQNLNCYSCHSTRPPAKCLKGESRLYQSHVFGLLCK